MKWNEEPCFFVSKSVGRMKAIERAQEFITVDPEILGRTPVLRHASTGRRSHGFAQKRDRSQESSRGVFDSEGRTPGSGPSVQ